MTLGMWDTWQAQVRAALPAFAASPWYVEQGDVTDAEMEAVVGALPVAPRDPAGMVRDVVHGGKVFATSRGPVTRMWVDGNTEIDFLDEALPPDVRLSALDVLDIGAGYGRLAVMLAPLVRSYTCVDAVAVSVEVCRAYTARYAPAVRVLDVAALHADAAIRPTLAINIHSWNECTLAQIVEWLDVLDDLAVPFLFTVSHTDGYFGWETGLQSFKPLLLERYDLLAEAARGIGRTPHALWRRR